MGGLAGAAAGALLARAGLRVAAAVAATPAGVGLRRRNYRGREVSLAGGVALAVAASAGAAVGALADGRGALAAASLVAGLGAAVVGAYDDAADGGGSSRAGAPGFGGVPVSGGAPAGGPDGGSGGAPDGGYGGAPARGSGGTPDGGSGGAPDGGPAGGLGAGHRQPPAKGFAGHLGALRSGRVTSGLVKIVGVGTAGAFAAASMPARRRGRLGRAAEVALGAGVIAGTANLVNLLDLRPGRALKAALLIGVPLALPSAARVRGWRTGPRGAGSVVAGGRGAGGVMAGSRRGGGVIAGRRGASGETADPSGARCVVTGPLGAAAALLPDDLGERVMLGDCGANALGALLGVALSARFGLVGRAALLGGLIALTAASEKVSFTTVIERSPPLRALDRLGRREVHEPRLAGEHRRTRSKGRGSTGVPDQKGGGAPAPDKAGEHRRTG